MNSRGEEWVNYKKKEQLDSAKHYISFGIKEGCYDPEEFEGMSDEELINFANDESGRAEAAYDTARDEGLV